MPFADALKRLLFAALRHTECAYYFQVLKDEWPIRERTSKLLRDNSLEWMLTEGKAHGLQIDEHRAARILEDECPPDYAGKAHESLTPFWWPLEFFPKGMRMNLFRCRGVRTLQQGTKVRLHESVLKRLKDATVSYRPSNIPSEYDVEKWVPYKFETD